MTTLNARAGQAWHEAIDGTTEEPFDGIARDAFEEGWETGYKTAAEELAEALVTAADELDMPSTVEWLHLRDWFKDLLHESAAVIRKEVES